MMNNAVTGFRPTFNKDPMIGGGGRTTQFFAHHPHNIADETEKRGSKSDEN
jgi:hypothetical protein